VLEATAAGRLPPDELLALRALATRPLRELLGVSSDPVGDYRAGRWEALADLERRELGLRR
jgi:hypothetical protein